MVNMVKLMGLSHVEFELKARDLSAFLYLKGSMRRDPENGLHYITKIVIVDAISNIAGIRKITNLI